MTAVLAAFSLQHEIEHYGAYAGIAAVFGLGILSLLYFAQAREVKRLREWAGRAPERAAELEARVTADAQRRVAPPVQPTPRPTAPATPAGQQSTAAPAPGIAAPATAAAGAAGAGGAAAATVAKPGTTAPQNGTGSNAAVPPPATPGTDAKPEDGTPQDGEAEKPAEAAATPAESESESEPKPFGPEPKPAEPDEGPPVPAVTAAAAAAAPGPRPAAPLRAPVPSASARAGGYGMPAGTRARTDAAAGRSPGRVAAIVGGVIGAIAVVAVAGILLFGGGGGSPPSKPNSVAQPTTGNAGAANGSATPKAPARLNRKAVPLAVLNGTTVTGLARAAADKLTAKGYNEPNVVTNDTTNQARPATQVFYEPKARAAALDVAKILGVPTAQVKPMDANARALSDRAEVAVYVGADKAQ